jgi:hypothetical protein
MRLMTQTRDQLVMVWRAEALAVANHVVNADLEVTPQVLRQAKGCTHLPFVIEDIRVAKTGVLDTYGRPVETDRVPTASPNVDQLVDPAAGRNDEMGADVRKLMKLRVRHVRRKRIEDTGHSGRLGNVLDDYVRMPQSPLRLPVVTQ